MLREEVLNSVRANVENENLIKHMLATEAIMRATSRRLTNLVRIPYPISCQYLR
jgi:predicted hydrolase (HD superfamily)